MWIHRYIDMNPHFSQNILNKGIFRMWIHRYIDMYPHCLGIKYKKGDMLYIFIMWIPRYIDMNPHFSQNILNKGIFRMWIHRYIDMYPHCLDNSNLVG